MEDMKLHFFFLSHASLCRNVQWLEGNRRFILYALQQNMHNFVAAASQFPAAWQLIGQEIEISFSVFDNYYTHD